MQLSSLGGSFLASSLIALVVTAVLALAFLALASRAPRLCLLVALVPLVLVYTLCADNRVYSIHGMVHTGIVYRAAQGGLPPENPFFAGAPLLYPWVLHAVVARIALALDLAPGWVFELVNLVAFLLIVLAIARLSDLCEGSASVRPFAVFLGVFASLGTLADSLQAQRAWGFWVGQGLPLGRKLTNVNLMPIGAAFALLGVWALLAVLDGPRVRRRHLVLLGAATVASGLLYPFAWLGLVVAGMASLAASLAWQRERRAAACVALLVLGASSAALAPYLRSLVAGKTPETAMHLALHGRSLAEHLVHALVLLSPFELLLVLRWRELRARLREGHWPTRHALLIGAALLATFACVSFPFGAEYKFETLAVAVLGVLGAPVLQRLHRTHAAAAFLVVVALLFSTTKELEDKLTRPSRVAEPYVEHGFALEHGDPRLAGLFRWIAAETPADAVFLDRGATLPIFGRRSVYVAGAVARPRHNGWGWTPDEWLHYMHGYAVRDIAERHRVVGALYGRTPSTTVAEARAELARFTAAGRPVYAVARDAGEEAVLARHPFLARVAGRDGWAVFRLGTADE